MILDVWFRTPHYICFYTLTVLTSWILLRRELRRGRQFHPGIEVTMNNSLADNEEFMITNSSDVYIRVSQKGAKILTIPVLGFFFFRMWLIFIIQSSITKEALFCTTQQGSISTYHKNGVYWLQNGMIKLPAMMKVFHIFTEVVIYMSVYAACTHLRKFVELLRVSAFYCIQSQ